jgi:hypothetical protein
MNMKSSSASQTKVPPINARLTAAAQHGETPSDARLLQQRWDSVITARSGLQILAILALCFVLIAT